MGAGKVASIDDQVEQVAALVQRHLQLPICEGTPS